MVRPDRFELPTFWFVAKNPRRINNLHVLSQPVTSYYFQWLTSNP